MSLSAHFALREFIDSPTARSQGITNEPDGAALANLERLADVLELVRETLGCPLRITSGYRCLELNRVVGGAKTSAHLEGRAADFRPLGVALADAFTRLAAATEIPFDQLIIERTKAGTVWLHLGIARQGIEPRREMLAADEVNGQMRYRRREG